MVDSRYQFMLSLQGKRNGGHMDYWSIMEGELSGLIKGHYILIARNWGYDIVDNEYVVTPQEYFTLGRKRTHKEMVKLYSDATHITIKAHIRKIA